MYFLINIETYVLFSRLDYAGISILIAGSGFPPLYYGLYCNLNIGFLYLFCSSSIAIALFFLALT